MVGAPDVDLPIEAALALVLVIGDIRGEVGVLAAGADQHAILVVTEVTRAQPQRALAAIRAPLLLEDRQRVGHRTRIALVQGALIGPVIEALHREGRERRLHLAHHDGDGGAPQLGGIDRVGLHQMDQLLDVGPPVAILGNRLAPGESHHRLAELAHLRAGVIDVELARHVVTPKFEHAGERIAVGGVAGVADVHRSGRVGRDELDQDALRRRGAPGAEPLAGGEHSGQRVRQP